MLLFWYYCEPMMEIRVPAGELGVTRVQQVTGLMEQPVITLWRFTAVEPGGKIDYTSGKTSGEYLWLFSWVLVGRGPSLTNRKLPKPSE